MHNQWDFNQTKSHWIFLGLDVIHRMNAVITAANSIRWRWEVQNDWKFSIFNLTNFRKRIDCDTFISTKVLKQIVYIPWKLFLELEAISLTHAHLRRFHFSINKELLVVRIRKCLFIVRPPALLHQNVSQAAKLRNENFFPDFHCAWAWGWGMQNIIWNFVYFIYYYLRHKAVTRWKKPEMYDVVATHRKRSEYKFTLRKSQRTKVDKKQIQQSPRIRKAHVGWCVRVLLLIVGIALFWVMPNKQINE